MRSARGAAMAEDPAQEVRRPEIPREDLDVIRDGLNEQAIASVVDDLNIEEMEQQAYVRAQVRAILTRYVWYDQWWSEER